MTAASRARFAEIVRSEPVDLALACLLVGVEVEPDLDVAVTVARLDALAAASRPKVPAGASPEAVAEGLRRALGEDAGLAGSAPDYDDLRSSLLHEVVRRRRGLPLLLSIVWLEVARRVGVPAHAVALPGHVVVAIGGPDERPAHVDPFAGGRRVEPSDIAPGVTPLPAEPLTLIARLLANVSALAARQSPTLEATRTRLWAVELTLLLPSHPAGLRRDRGHLLVRLGDHLGGAAELEAYAGLVADAQPDLAAACLRDARAARARLN